MTFVIRKFHEKNVQVRFSKNIMKNTNFKYLKLTEIDENYVHKLN